MRLAFLVLVTTACLGPIAAAANTPPIDLETVRASTAVRHLQDLASVIESYDPFLETAEERAGFDVGAKRLEAEVHGQIHLRGRSDP